MRTRNYKVFGYLIHLFQIIDLNFLTSMLFSSNIVSYFSWSVYFLFAQWFLCHSNFKWCFYRENPRVIMVNGTNSSLYLIVGCPFFYNSIMAKLANLYSAPPCCCCKANCVSISCIFPFNSILFYSNQPIATPIPLTIIELLVVVLFHFFLQDYIQDKKYQDHLLVHYHGFILPQGE